MLDSAPVPLNPGRRTQATVCLVMIVKNEAAVIRRCLDTVIPFIDRWSICDTGSTDGTQELIREALAGIPGRLHQDPWVDFGHNRSLALSKARGMADYHLLINADETLAASGDFRHLLVHDQYMVRVDSALEYQVATLVSDGLRWRYVGATHEYIDTDVPYSRGQLPDVVLTHHADGGSRGDKFERDLRLLTRAVEERPDDPRSLFYLAQTLRDMDRREEAIEWYAKRADAGGWDEEVYQSLYQIARLRHLSEAPWETVLASYLTAYEYRPTRLEPLLHVARHYRERGQHRLGHLYSRPVVDTPYPASDLLFVERGVYHYELPLEYGICCYWIGRHREAIRVNDAILASPGVPAGFLEAARRNRQFSLDALAR
jgi:glycosyltransferase involved in cell wall biosynthesis